jgi:MFS family permease
MIHVPEKQEAVEGDPEESKHPISYALQGFVILGKLPQLLIVFLSFCVLAIVYIPTEMVVLPRYYNGVGHPELTGYLITAMSVFTVFGSLAFEKLVKIFGHANTVRFGLIAIGIPMLPMSQLPDFWVMIVLGAVLGFAWGPMMPILNTLIQTMVPANIRGRVFAVEGVMWNIAPLTSFILVGIGLDNVGVKPVYLTLAILVTLFALAISFSPQLRKLNKVAAEAKANAEAV